jgi:hypothetical protein
MPVPVGTYIVAPAHRLSLLHDCSCERGPQAFGVAETAVSVGTARSPMCPTKRLTALVNGLQVDLIGCDRFLIPFKANARHVRNVKQPVTNFIGLL